MADTNGGDSILQDHNFKTLASQSTDSEEFLRLIEANVYGYSQRKRLADGLKDLKAKVEAAENKQNAVKALGKAKKMEDEEQALVDNYNSCDVAEKMQVMNKMTQAMLDEGQLTSEEIPHVLEHFRSRREAAKAADKAKLVEKLERNLTLVSKAKSITLPLANLEEIVAMRDSLEEAQRLEKRPTKSLSEEERQKVTGRPKLQLEVKALEGRSRMWFETELEFKPRLERTVDEYVKSQAEQRRLAAEQAVERKRREEEQALEQKRLEAKQKEEEQHKQLMQKLEAKRLEAQAKPQKPAPQPKQKEKVKRTKLDPHELFTTPQGGQQEGSGQEDVEDAGEAELADAASAALVEEEEPVEVPAPQQESAKVPAPEPPKRQPRPALESRWGAALAPAAAAWELREEELLGEAGPSLAEAAAAPRRRPQPPQPSAPSWKEAPVFQPPPREAENESDEEDDDLRALPSTSMEPPAPDIAAPAPAAPPPAAQPVGAPPAAAAAVPATAAESAAAPPAAPSPPELAARPRPAKAVLECKWDSPALAVPVALLGEDDDAVAGPSLAEAAVAAKSSKKAPVPQAKKKEKKKFTKMAVSDLGFDANNPNYN